MRANKKLIKIYINHILYLFILLLLSVMICFLFCLSKNIYIIMIVCSLCFIMNFIYILRVILAIKNTDKTVKFAIEKELRNPIYENADVILTENYIMDLHNLHIIKYDNIKSMHKKHRVSIYTVIIYDQIVIITKNSKTIKIPITNILPFDIHDYGQEILKIIKSKNPNILIKTKKSPSKH